MLSRPDPHMFNERVWLADLLSACKKSLKTPKCKESLKLQKALKKVWSFTHELSVLSCILVDLSGLDWFNAHSVWMQPICIEYTYMLSPLNFYDYMYTKH